MPKFNHVRYVKMLELETSYAIITKRSYSTPVPVNVTAVDKGGRRLRAIVCR